MSAENPFFSPWTNEFGFPPFDLIKPEHIPAALERGMEEGLAEFEAIANSSEPPTFANTIEAMEAAGRLLNRVCSVFFNLNSSDTNDALEAIARDFSPKLSQYNSKISLNPVLFERVADLHARRDTLGLEPDQMRLLERSHLGFVRSGAALDPAAKARMAETSERLATLTTLFGQHVQADEQAWQLVLEETDLDGLPGYVREAAAQAAAERGLEGKYVITLLRSSVEPFLTFSTRRDLREKAQRAWTSRGANAGETDNRDLIREIVALRTEQARMLGYPTYADYKLDDTMAKTPTAVLSLLNKVWEPARVQAIAERGVIQAEAEAAGFDGGIEAWDWRFYAERVRKARYDLDDGEVKPYFLLENMVQAAFDTATKLFGVSFVARDDLPVYHPDAHVYEVRETGTGRHVGLFIQDNFARASKRSGAWMSSYRDGESYETEITPIIVNNSNFAKSSPSLLTFNDAETLFHEFGHALHGLLSKARYPSQSGTSVRRDFVEFPSQVYEHWLTAPETLRVYATHFQTGEPIPEELLGRLLEARKFGQGFNTVAYTGSALIDMEIHSQTNPDNLDPEAFERDVLDRLGMPKEVGLMHRLPHFKHLFSGGYAAGYYSYMWSEVLDADGFDAFKEAGDIFDPRLAAKLKDIYEAGDTRDPMELYVAFRGREPETDALLRHRGLPVA
ncbi:peptidase M3 [Skermanella stibiiresistens SB22]|uniref:Peptidase M3 n=1 Tax=Skermanella stibiiresistens SB22 TaxID=1385369 RepID=W9GV33_9PROT|nr:M3 family metallopeptidase [Skermanella stibiiresistens]EWY37634.1 peptidase M3 [Skermanella stibiiresistens SB22]